jgi:hypothetical protein
MRAFSLLVGGLLASVCWPFKAAYRALGTDGNSRT